MRETSEELEKMFEEKAKHPSGLSAKRDLSLGHWISYREKDTPPGHVLRKHPGGRIELIKVDLAMKQVL